jgi:hypothetical protein
MSAGARGGDFVLAADGGEEAFQMPQVRDGGAQLDTGRALGPVRPEGRGFEGHAVEHGGDVAQGGRVVGLGEVHEKGLAESLSPLPVLGRAGCGGGMVGHDDLLHECLVTPRCGRGTKSCRRNTLPCHRKTKLCGQNTTLCRGKTLPCGRRTKWCRHETQQCGRKTKSCGIKSKSCGDGRVPGSRSLPGLHIRLTDCNDACTAPLSRQEET